MKILRLFITSDLSKPINWMLVGDNDKDSETGTSSLNEIAAFNDVSIEVYLSTNCCSIFKTSVAGIASRRITEELMLGLIEDSLTDEIDEVKAITLQVEDDIAYVAVFNKIFYQTLMEHINNLEKPIRFIQSFAFATKFEEKSWTLFLGEEQSFIRTSKFEYYSLDDSRPIPAILDDMLQIEKPKSLLIYADANYNTDEIVNKYGIECKNLNNEFEYSLPVWNFYIQKSTSFNIKLDKKNTKSLLSLLKTIKYLVIFLVLFWFLDVTTLFINGLRVKSQINKNLRGVVTVNEINSKIIQNASDKITTLRHLRGIYDSSDAVVILTKFLQVVSTITPDDIKQVNYTNGELEIFVGSSFDTSLFNSYKDVLKTRKVSADIEDYKTYAKANKSKTDASNNNIDAQTQVITDAAWVITLKPSFWHELIRKQ